MVKLLRQYVTAGRREICGSCVVERILVVLRIVRHSIDGRGLRPSIHEAGRVHIDRFLADKVDQQ